MNNHLRGNAGSGLSITTGRTFERLPLSKETPELKAIIDKLVLNPHPQARDIKGNREIDLPGGQLINRVSEQTAISVADADATLQILPDVELSKQILVSSILSPKDMVGSDLNYRINGDLLDSEVSSTMIAVISDYFDNTYNIRQKLPDMLGDALFMTGSYPLIVMPESAIDDAINSRNRVTSMEALSGELEDNGRLRPIGFLGNKPEPGAKLRGSFESLLNPNAGPAYNPAVENEAELTITDNFNVLKLPTLHDKLLQDRVQDLLSVRQVGIESHRTVSADKTERSLYRRRHHTFTPVLRLKPQRDLDRKSVGHPLVMKLPSESVIPVHVPGNPKEHIGFFVLLDEFGNPINRAQFSDYYRGLESRLQSTSDTTSRMLQEARTAYVGNNNNDTRGDLDAATLAYTDIVETELVERLSNGLYGKNVSLGRPNEVYRIMLARACANMQTQLLYVPSDLMTYIAFDYNSNGVGKSLLEASKIISGIRSLLLFSDTMAAVKNSVGRVGLKIQLDPQDTDPSGTVDFLTQEYFKNRNTSYPLGVSNPSDIISYLQTASVDLQVSGNTAYPETTIDVEDKSSSIVRLDSGLSEDLKKQHIMSFGLSPETVDASFNLELATSVVSSNLLLSKRVCVYQESFCPQVSDHIRKYTLNSAILMDQLRAIVTTNLAKLPKPEAVKGGTVESDESRIENYLMDFIQALEVTLPRPDSVTLDNQVDAFTKYQEGLELALKAYIDSAFIDADTLGDVGVNVDTILAALKAYYSRQWLRDNNVFAELNDLTALGEDKGPAFKFFEAHRDHIEGLSKTLEGLAEFIKEQRAKGDKRRTEFDAKLEEKYGVTPEMTGEGSDGGEEAGGGEEGGDEFEMGNLDEMPTDDIPLDETEPTDGEPQVADDTEPAEEEPAAVEKTDGEEDPAPEENPKPAE